MRYTEGELHQSMEDLGASDWSIDEAIVTNERIAIDWHEDEDAWVLLATSEDGVEYRGTYGIDRPDPGREITLWRYTAVDGRVALLCEWREPAAGDGGWCMWELHPPE